ncbi:uncharacterized protein K444DRAFT_722122, partial [Hyaloscypha bicolor E]
ALSLRAERTRLNVPAVVLRWITTHPGQSALLITNGILIFTPAALTGPLLATMGFGASGPVAGELRRRLASVDTRECRGT